MSAGRGGVEALECTVCCGLQGAASGARRAGAGRVGGVSYVMKRSLVIILKGFTLECNRMGLVP